MTRSIVVGLVFLGAAAVAAAREYAQAPCQAHLDGAQFPFLVPEYRVWEDIFSRAPGTQTPEGAGPPLSEPGSRSLRAMAPIALKTFAGARDASRPAAAADLLLEARDDLLRTLSADDTARLVEHADAIRRQTRYTFPKPGTRADQNAVATCPVSISGQQHPELIPEPYYWEFYLRSRAWVSAQRKTGAATYTADFMSALRQHHLPIPEREVVLVLTTGEEMVPDVDAARAKYRDSRDAERAVASIVRAARLKLLRSLPRDSWIVVQRDAARTRGGTVYDFPTTF